MYYCCFQIILSELINENELKSMFEAISCDFDLSPFSHENLNFDEADNKIIMKLKENKLKSKEILNKGEKKKISIEKVIGAVKNVFDKYQNIKIQVKKVNEDIVYQKKESTVGDLLYYKKYTKSENGRIEKESRNGAHKIIVANNEYNSDIFNIETSNKTVKKHCTKRMNGDTIKTVVTGTENQIIQTAIRFANGKYFYASAHEDISIMMGQYQNSVTQNSIFLPSQKERDPMSGYDYSHYSSLLTDKFDNKDLVEDLFFKYMISYVDSHFPNHIRNYRNNGIIIHHNFIMISDRYRKYSKRSSSKESYNNDLPYQFQKVPYSDAKILAAFNIRYPGLLLCLTPRQELYKTSDNKLIDRFIQNNGELDFHWCGVVSYMSADSKQLWIKNYGIIENGRLVETSENLFENGNILTYFDGVNQIVWNSTVDENEVRLI